MAVYEPMGMQERTTSNCPAAFRFPLGFYGGDGDDRIKGGAGHDVLLGEHGNDLLVGGNGRDLLIGGMGADRILGNADDDILIAGTLIFDQFDLAVEAIMAEWCSQRNYQTRITNLGAKGIGERLNGDYFLLAGDHGTVRDDDQARDFLTGSAGDDWFFFRDSEDRATDLTDEVFANDFGWIKG